MIDRNEDFSDLSPQLQATIAALDALFGAMDKPKQLAKAKSNVIKFTPMDPEITEKLKSDA